MAVRRSRSSSSSLASRLARVMPTGSPLPESIWEFRHRVIRIIVIVHAGGLAMFGLQRGYPMQHVALEASFIGLAGLLAGLTRLGRIGRSVLATLGLVASAAMLVHLSGGMIEAHFHFFVILGIISLYQSWVPLMTALAFVLIHHGALGVLEPSSVYNHGAAVAHPWRWAAVHAGAVLAATIVNIVSWRLNESSHAAMGDTLSLLTATLESTADGILVVDNNGAITAANRRFAEMWGIPDEVLKTGEDDRAIAFVLEQLADPARFIAKVEQLYGDPSAESFDELSFKDGRVFERYSKPQLVNDQAVGRVWSFRDVTERNRLDQMKDAFLSAVSHELRTPLTGILGYAVTLRNSDHNLDLTQRREVLERLEVCARKLQRLLNDTIDLDRLSRGVITPLRQPTDISDLALRIAEEVESAKHSIVVRSGPVIAPVDAAKVERLLENLLINGIRHTPGGTRIEVRVAPLADGGATITVDDDGPGVPLDERTLIFNRFHRGAGSSAYSPGFGIGLAMVADLCAIHGGKAWVETSPFGGARFCVTLPATGPHDRQPIAPDGVTETALSA